MRTALDTVLDSAKHHIAAYYRVLPEEIRVVYNGEFINYLFPRDFDAEAEWAEYGDKGLEGPDDKRWAACSTWLFKSFQTVDHFPTSDIDFQEDHEYMITVSGVKTGGGA